MIRIIEDKLYYLGVNDRQKTLFEGLWPLPLGVSYNSYLLKGEQTVLFDTVDNHFAGEFIHKLKEALDGKSLDYLVINHMEPDHSGSIAILRRHFPQAQIVGNARTLDMVKGYYGIEENTRAIKNGEELSLGNYTLRFYLTPMVHWPETMMTYVPETQTLFSGDAFGTFGALDGGVKDSQLNTDKYWEEMIRYYANIVGKYGSPVQKALQKLANTPIKTICSTHGPVWTEAENINKVVSLYDRLSRYEAIDRGVVIVYGSMYGHTAALAEQIAAELSELGVREIVVHDASVTHSSYILKDIFKYKTLVVGSPTYNNQLFPEIESLLSKIQARDVKNRNFAYFGGFTWAGAAVKRLTEFAENSGFEQVGSPVEMKQGMFASVQEEIKQLAQAIAEKTQ